MEFISHHNENGCIVYCIVYNIKIQTAFVVCAFNILPFRVIVEALALNLVQYL